MKPFVSIRTLIDEIRASLTKNKISKAALHLNLQYMDVSMKNIKRKIDVKVVVSIIVFSICITSL